MGIEGLDFLKDRDDKEAEEVPPTKEESKQS